MSQPQHLAILVGGGPAPGINSVIASATIRAILEGVEVIGIRDGFEWIMKGDTSHITPLTTHEISRIHFRGGSRIGISRANPTKVPKTSRDCSRVPVAAQCLPADHDRRR
jgi:ATP-dependent phosphofructokinase / diphosphate-dependent phosphofructokinase